MVNLPVIPSQYVETAHNLLSSQPLSLIIAQLLQQIYEADQKAMQALKRAAHSEHLVNQADLRIEELKSILLLMSAEIEKVAATPAGRKTPPVHTRSFGGNIIDTPDVFARKEDNLVIEPDPEFPHASQTMDSEEEIVEDDSEEEDMGAPNQVSEAEEDLSDYDRDDETGGTPLSDQQLEDTPQLPNPPTENGSSTLLSQSRAFVDDNAMEAYPESPYGVHGYFQSPEPVNNTYETPKQDYLSTPTLTEDYEVVTSPAPSDPDTPEPIPTPQKPSQRKESIQEADLIKEDVGPKVGTLLSSLITDVNSEKEARVLRMGLKIGDEVELFGNQTGIVKYAGTTQFGNGNYFGVELNDGSIGKNNGDHDQIQYFSVSKAMKGVFVRAKMIRRKVPLLQATAFRLEQEAKERKARQLERQKQTQTVEKKKKHIEKKAATNFKKEEKRVKKMGLEVGDDVQIDMGRKGMVAFIGVIEALHPKWTQYGIALTHGSIGDTQGTIDGVEYFRVEENRGVFVTADKIRKRVFMSAEEKYTQRIEDIFEEYCPKKLGNVRKIVKDADNLHNTYLRYCHKYGVTPAPPYRGKKR